MVETEKSAHPHEACDLIVKNAYLVTLDATRRLIPDGAVAVSARRILAVGKSTEILARYRSRRTLDAGGGIVHPGFIEPHIHISQHHSRSPSSVFNMLNPPLRYAEWKANLLEEEEYPSSVIGCLELLQAGFTSFVEPGTAFSPDAVAEAAKTVGMRGWVTDPYLWDHGATLELYPSLISPALMKRVPCDLERCLRELGKQLPRNRDPDALVKGHVAVYGEATASDELRRAAKACARDNGVTFTEHLGFAPAIAKAEEARLGKTQVQHAAALGILDRRTTCVHMNMLHDVDMEIVRTKDIAIVWCAANYLFTAASSGTRTRLPALARDGVAVALGIDTPGNTNPGDTPTIAYLAAREAGDAVSWEQLLEMQTLSAARTIGAEADIGSLEAGKRADLVIRDASDLGVYGFDPVYELALFQRARNVDTAIVNGEIVLRGGHSTRIDEGVAQAEARASMNRIVRRIGMQPGGRWPVVS